MRHRVIIENMLGPRPKGELVLPDVDVYCFEFRIIKILCRFLIYFFSSCFFCIIIMSVVCMYVAVNLFFLSIFVTFVAFVVVLLLIHVHKSLILLLSLFLMRYYYISYRP